MLDGIDLIAAVAFQTNRGGVAGASTIGDLPTNAGTAIGSRGYRCLVSGSTQTGAAAAVAAGRYSCTLAGGNDDIAVSDLQLMAHVTDSVAGSAIGAGWVKVTRTAASIFEVDIYTAVAGVPALADIVPAAGVWQVNVSWYRVNPG